MARIDNRYSRFVAALKILLPLAALALLSTLFLLASDGGEGRGLPVGEILADGEMAGFRYTARTEGGDLTVTGDRAAPRAANYARVEVSDIVAVLDGEGGVATRLTARTGLLDRREERATFTGEVRVETSDGWRIDSAALATAFDGTWVESPGAVAVTGPGLDLSAGSMRLDESAAGTPAGHALFNGGVRLVYTPQSD
jgi:lipopolysaccharide export system protein LptC